MNSTVEIADIDPSILLFKLLRETIISDDPVDPQALPGQCGLFCFSTTINGKHVHETFSLR